MITGMSMESGRSVQSALRSYAKFRFQQIVLLKDQDDAQLDKSATHPQYIFYSIRTLVSHMLFHEYRHMYRIVELWLIKKVSKI
jgi:hypothetical protein